ncbi:MAG TPA: tetratricopeptide repeat protein [Bradyrhizobium sp.]|nr:tetratricopeptide repeat protein [Bradyrhizobium sp.]
MARAAVAGFFSLARTSARNVSLRLGRGAWLTAALVVAGLTTGDCRADPIKGEATFSASGGFARLVFKLAEDVASEVSTAGSILVIRFAQPVDIPIDKWSEAVPAYVGSARRDPDGSAIRLALARRVTVNTMTAGERVFVDLLPDTWSGPPPSLPPEVVRELAERARAAERALRMQRAVAETKKRAPIRVRASMQPTFVRLVFEMPDGIGVSSVLNDQKLTLMFNALLTFDLADAKEAAPSNVASIKQKVEGDTSTVEVTLLGNVDVRSFREDKNYIVDLAFQQSDKSSGPSSRSSDSWQSPAPAVPSDAAAAPAPPVPTAPVIANGAPVIPLAAPEKSIQPAAPARESAQMVQPASETIAKAANIEIKPEAAPKVSSASEPPSTERPANEPPSPTVEIPATLATAEPPAEITPPAAGAGNVAAGVGASRTSDRLELTFPFAAPTAAALFRRADTVWLVFDTREPIDLEPIRNKGGSIISDVAGLPLENGQAIRLRLNRPQMPSLVGEDQVSGGKWTLTFADTMRTPIQPLAAIRNIIDPALANLTVPLSKSGLLHRFVDPDAGDTLMVVTAPPPVRGFIKRQDFVEFSLLESIHGIAIRPNSDDVTAEIAYGKIVLARPGGLTLSSAAFGAERATTAVRPIFDIVEWRKNQSGNFFSRADQLAAAVVAAEPEQRTSARVDLARFYVSRGMYAEAKGVLDNALADAKPGLEDPIALIVHSVASSLMGRPEVGLKDLASPVIGTKFDHQMWQALAYARLGKWPQSREKFMNSEFVISSLPIELQSVFIADAMRASVEVNDYSGAAKRSSDLDVVGIPPEMKATISVLRGRLAEGLSQDRDALDHYKKAIDSRDRAAAAEAKLLTIAMKQRRNEISPADMLREVETLAVMWRGDGIEVRTLQILARIYAEKGRYSESFAAARTATRLQPNSEAARECQDEAAARFAQLFLSPKGDDLPTVDALGMFYEYRELTPIGRRGDEMIRRLADRLVAVDLLDQASELLQYQVDKRLEGSARAQVAARLATVYLTSRKPDRAISALRSTRIADLSGELRQQRLLLEARAQSDVGRHDLGLDIISSFVGREAIRLRSDIFWAARRWREASEQIELYYADRWRDFKPLNPVEKGDVIRAVVGYALAEDVIGLARFREKYAPLMSGEADRAAFETASKPAPVNSAEFGKIAKMAASVDTLDGFLREMKMRFPDTTARAPLPSGIQKADPFPTGSLPQIIGLKRAARAK